MADSALDDLIHGKSIGQYEPVEEMVNLNDTFHDLDNHLFKDMDHDEFLERFEPMEDLDEFCEG